MTSEGGSSIALVLGVWRNVTVDGRVGHPLGNASRVNEMPVLCGSKVSAISNTVGRCGPEFP